MCEEADPLLSGSERLDQGIGDLIGAGIEFGPGERRPAMAERDRRRPPPGMEADDVTE